MKSSNRKLTFVSVILLAGLLLAACSSAAPTAAPTVSGSTGGASPTMAAPTEAVSASPTAEAAAAAAGVVVNVGKNDSLGDFLVDGKGMSLYIFTNDEPGKSNCTGDCLVKWPPLLSDTLPTAGTGVDASKLSLVTMADGSKIVAYNDMPLYYYFSDVKPGDITGQGVGSVWYVIDPAGNIVGK